LLGLEALGFESGEDAAGGDWHCDGLSCVMCSSN
jgi:hypothetical protein